MKDVAKRRPSPALVISCLALFVALSGSAVALQGVNRVRSDDIARFAVKRTDLAPNSVAGGKVVNDSLTGGDINESTLAGDQIPGIPSGGGGGGAPTGPAGGGLTGNYPNPQIAANAVDSGNVALDSLAAADLAANSVGSSEIAAGAVGTSELANNAVPGDGDGTDGSTRLATNSVAYQEIVNGQIVGPLLAPITIRSAQVVNSNVQKTADVSCLGSERMLSGGGGIPNPTPAFTIARTVPLQNGWVVVAHGPAQQWTLQVYAVCLAGP